MSPAPGARWPMEAVDIVHLAHPAKAGPAIAAGMAGHDLLGDHPVTQLHAVVLLGTLAHLHHMAPELVARDHRRGGTKGGGPFFVSPPKPRGGEETPLT